ncbi:conserved hypothetical protein [Ricinus communis]|uniref:Transmembrane protein n=1 Tax=Ricinus communis TaxID=3988 RepID=B9SUU7_RICCO|nr:conserved hypothetical protein [Ricinus communis]|eukprot:XP_002529766.1 uncharacterized protein LOC8264305 isoform X1 [Ricinus communis]
MALAFMYSLKNLWPLSILKYDDLKASNELVSKLSIPENTKRFVYAVRDPDSQSVIYMLSVQNLSQRSAIDADCLIRAIRPEAVVAQVSNSAMSEIQAEYIEFGSNLVDNPVPTSSFGVIKRCFIDKTSKDKYETVACNLVLKEIFGVGFYGHIMAAKRVAKEIGSSFMLLETPVVQSSAMDNNSSSEVDAGSKVQGLVSSLVPNNAGYFVSSSTKRFRLTDDVQSQMVKLLSSYMDASLRKLGPSNPVSEVASKEIHAGNAHQVPPFAQSIYPLLLDLHNIFVDISSISRALASSQKMFYDVSRGECVDIEIISEVYTFRIAVEGLRIALTNAGQLPIKSLGKANKTKVEFLELPVEDKSSALLAQALQSQTRKFKKIVALVDSSSLAGLRKHWNTSVPPEIQELVGQLASDCDTDEEFTNQTDKKSLFSNKPVMAVGAGATAVLGASSLSKVVPTSTLLKALTFKLPAPLNFVLTQTQKSMAVALGKTLGSSKVVAPGLANSGANATSVLKTAASAEKIRAVVHSMIASVEKTSFSAMRTAFFEIMRKRRVQPIGFLPWATFGCSIATCSGLLMYGDGIECAVECVPAAPSIASLGRGIENLHQASQKVSQTDRIQKAIELLMYRLRKVKIQ